MNPPTHPTLAMFDSVDVPAIPADAKAVAGYVNGSYVTVPELRKRFPHAHVLTITVAGHTDAHARCIDVEPSDATNQTCLDWLQAHKDGRDYLLLTAHYTGAAHICGPRCGFGLEHEADGTQWTDHALGRNLDESRVHRRLFEKPHHPVVYTSLSNAQPLVNFLAAHGVHRATHHG